MRIRIKSMSLSAIYELLEVTQFRPLYAVQVETSSKLYRFQYVIVDNPNAFTVDEIASYKILVKKDFN